MESLEKIIQLAYAHLISEVFLHLRNGMMKDQDQLRDLGDALHNISGILGAYGAWIDDPKYRTLYLIPYDTRWGTQGLSLELFLNARIDFYTKT
jgi:hypothetical protein